MSLRYYIATKLERHADHNLVRDTMAAQGHTITYDWSTHGPVFRHGVERIREVSLLETQGVLDADLVIVLLPGGRGTHAELGMALAAGKPVILHQLRSPLVREANLFGATPETCAFYHHPLCFHAPPIGLDALWSLAVPWVRQVQEERGITRLAWVPA